MLHESILRQLTTSFGQNQELFESALSDFQRNGVDRVAIFRECIESRRRFLAVYLLNSMQPEELQRVFASLVMMMFGSHGTVGRVRESILRIPKDWLLTKIEAEIEPYLTNGDDSEYRRVIELYELIDSRLASQFLSRCRASANPHIREIASEFE